MLSAEQAQVFCNVRRDCQENMRAIQANVELRRGLFALLREEEVRDPTAMIQGLQMLGLRVTNEFTEKSIAEMRTAIRDEFIPALVEATFKKADHIGLEMEFPESDEWGVPAHEFSPEAKEVLTALKVEYDLLSGAEEDENKNGFVVVKDGCYRVSTTVKQMDFGCFARALCRPENIAALDAVYQSMKAGGKPAILHLDDSGKFAVGETFTQTLPSRAHCVYDKQAERMVGEEKCGGNAVDQSAAMGMALMMPQMGSVHFTRFDDTRKNCSDFLLQDSDKGRQQDFAYVLKRVGSKAEVELSQAQHHANNQGWRGVVWVQL